MARVPYLDQSDLAPENRACWRAISISTGVTHRPEQRAAFPVWRSTSVITASRERAAQSNLSDETFGELKKDLDDERIVDLLMVISFYCGVVRLLAALQIDVKEDYRKYLEAFSVAAVNGRIPQAGQSRRALRIAELAVCTNGVGQLMPSTAP